MRIGTVGSIVRYPVKSMAGEPIETGFLGYAGLFGDRVYAFVQNDGRKGFPWFTIRELEDLVLYKARFRAPDLMRTPRDIEVSLGLGVGVAPVYPESEAFGVEVETPDGETYPIDSAALNAHLQKRSERKLALRFSDRSQSDCRPLSIFANTTLKELSSQLKRPLDPRRFRANLYVDWSNAEPFYEDSLVGRVLKLGERSRIMVTERDPRCKIITVDPDSGDESPQILRHIATTRQGMAGIYGAVLQEGLIHVGDPIELID